MALSNKTLSNKTVAIIGTGNIGGKLAANFAAGNLDFLLAGRDLDAAEKVASGLGGRILWAGNRILRSGSRVLRAGGGAPLRS